MKLSLISRTQKTKQISQYINLLYSISLLTKRSERSTLTKPIRTIRASKVVVDTDNLGELTFEINPEGDEANKSVSKETMMTVIVVACAV